MTERGDLPPDNLNNPSLCIPFGDTPDKVQQFVSYLTVIIQCNSTRSNTDIEECSITKRDL